MMTVPPSYATQPVLLVHIEVIAHVPSAMQARRRAIRDQSSGKTEPSGPAAAVRGPASAGASEPGDR